MVGQWRVRPEAQVNGFYWKGLGLSSFAERDDRRRLRDSGHVNRERTLMCGVRPRPTFTPHLAEAIS